MLLTQSTFLFIFLPALLASYYLVVAASNSGLTYAGRDAANAILAVASLLFYGLAPGHYLWLLCALIAVNWCVAAAIDRRQAGSDRSSGMPTTLLWCGVAVNLLVLGAFRYASAPDPNVGTFSLVLGRQPMGMRALFPLGLAFLTLHSISYLVDTYRRERHERPRFLDTAVYLSFFPVLMAGPIVRYRDFVDQIAERVVSVGNFVYGVRRFVVGLCKKLLIADVVGLMADRVFGMPSDRVGAGTAWFGLLCYTLQIYFTLGGYSDMAIGLGRMFGFRLPENFRWPYVADSVQEFWRRWMISLSTWSRDYVYRPLVGDSVSGARMLLHMLTAFVLCGLWHGSSWNLIIWGLYHGVFIALERAGLAATLKGLPVALRHVYLIVVVMIGWVFFRTESVLDALIFLNALAGLQTSMAPVFALQPHPTFYFWLALLAGLFTVAPLVGSVSRWRVTIDAATVSALVMLFATGVFIFSSIRSLLATPHAKR